MSGSLKEGGNKPGLPSSAERKHALTRLAPPARSLEQNPGGTLLTKLAKLATELGVTRAPGTRLLQQGGLPGAKLSYCALSVSMGKHVTPTPFLSMNTWLRSLTDRRTNQRTPMPAQRLEGASRYPLQGHYLIKHRWAYERLGLCRTGGTPPQAP